MNERFPPPIPTDQPTPARIYDVLLGGKDNFQVDRDAAAQALDREPNSALVVAQNRAFLRRVVADLVGQGIRQIIDLGSGLPEQDNVHQVAQSIAPETRVVYVDNDPIVLTHGKALLADNANVNTTVITADLRDTQAVLTHPETQRLIDFTQPWALLAIAVFHFVSQDPSTIVGAYREHMPAGSALALSHLSQDATTPEIAAEITAIYQQATAPMVLRSYAQIAEIFTGFEVVDPGLPLIMNWRPEAIPEAPERVWLYGGLGYRPS